MSMVASLPYGIKFGESGTMEVFPAAEMNFIGKDGRGIRAVLLIDSGATTTALPLTDASTLGIAVNKKKKVLVRGIGEQALIGYKIIVSCELEEWHFRAPVVFVDSPNVPRVLGREGIFHLFGILFDEQKNRTVFIDMKSPRARRMIDNLVKI